MLEKKLLPIPFTFRSQIFYLSVNIFNILFQLVWHLEPPEAGLKTGRGVDSRLVIASTTSLSSGGVVLMTLFGNLGDILDAWYQGHPGNLP